MKEKKLFNRIVFVGVLFFMSLVLTSISFSDAMAGSTKLIFGSFLPEHDFQAITFKALGEELEKISEGDIKVEFSFGGALGPPPNFYDVVVNNVCDVGTVLPGAVKGRFPMTDVINNAWVFPNPDIATRTYWEFHMRGYFEKEFSDSKLLYVMSGGGDPGMWTTNKRVSEIEQARGLKIRTFGGPMTERIKALGCVPVSMSITEVYQALQKGTVDGMITAWGGMDSWKLYEVIKYSTGPGVGGGPLVVVMNRNTFDKLPENVKTAIDEMWTSGKYSIMAGKKAAEAAEKGKSTFIKHGGEMVEWSQAALDEMDKLWAPIWEKWIAEMDKKGMPPKKMINEMYSYLTSLGIERPAIGYTP
jgi:TRAP-type C4-dicarboxylate transport system substrate-binding protein